MWSFFFSEGGIEIETKNTDNKAPIFIGRSVCARVFVERELENGRIDLKKGISLQFSFFSP